MRDHEWVFAYGSLLWDPGFAPEEALRARLTGFRRSFCMWSHHYRGTEEVPGLVLALEEDGDAACEGLALRPQPQEREAVMEAIRRRELVSDAYEERWLPVRLQDGREVTAVAYVVQAGHRQHACVDAETQARTIARARGRKGPNLDYLLNTARRLRELGIEDREIEALSERARGLAA